jgi:hypothetical protein
MRPALPVHVGDVDQAQVRLVNERRGLEGMVRALVAHVAMRDALQFGVDERDQLLERGSIAASPGRQEPGHVGRRTQRQDASSKAGTDLAEILHRT